MTLFDVRPAMRVRPAARPDFVLGLDLDGVVGDYSAIFRLCVAEQWGVDPATLPTEVSWDFASWGVRDAEHFAELHRRAVTEQRMFARMPVVPGAVDALWELSDAGVWIRILTHRLCVNGGHRIAVADTVSWLEEHRIPFRELNFIGDKPAVGADCYLDDGPHNIAALRAAGCDAIVYDAPYNQGVDGPRVADWSEARAIILDRLARHRARPVRRSGAVGDRLR